MYLVDTDIVSLMRRPDKVPALSGVMLSLPPDGLYLSVMTLGEIERGIERQRLIDPKFADALVQWQAGLETAFGDKILPVTRAIAYEWGRIGSRVGHTGTDILLAATAIVHGLTVITRNVKHFGPTGVPIINPLEAPPSTVQ